MPRLHLVELEDLNWFPAAVRNCLTDYLQFSLQMMKPYSAMVPLLAKALQQTGSRQIVDLCSGASGPWAWLRPELAAAGIPVSVCLTDKYPNLDSFQASVRSAGGEALSFSSASVDAMSVPTELKGFRTLFTSFHHFRPDQARAVLADAIRRREGIGIFEVTARRPLPILFTMLSPLPVLFFTPGIRPFRWSRLFWTYLLPLVPAVTLFDGLVSCLRTYTPRELEELTRGLGPNDYQWEAGRIHGQATPVPVTYLIGLPRN